MILSCGEALIDMLPCTATTGAVAFTPHPGGAVFNTAIALGRLGAPSAFFSGVSTDLLGKMLADTLTAAKVDTSYLSRADRPTTLAFVKLVNGQASYAFYDENTAGLMLSQDDLPVLPAKITTLFFGGISLVNDPAASTYEALQRREAGARVTMIDPNIRPGFVAGKEPAYRARISRMMARADIVKLSDEDMQWLMGPGDVVDLAHQILTSGPKVVVVTEGAAGARAITARQNRFVPAHKVTVADTVGAGDTFNAGLLTALQEVGALTKARLAQLTDAELDSALALGTRVAAITVSRSGANSPWRSEL